MNNIPEVQVFGEPTESSEDFGIGLTSERASELDAIRVPRASLAAATEHLVSRNLLPSIFIGLVD